MEPWREYEEGICEMLRVKVEADSRVEFDVKLAGRLSGIERQVDVYVEGRFSGNVLPDLATLSVDCKCWSSTVDVSDVERFIGLVEDVGTDLGLMITTVGYSSASSGGLTSVPPSASRPALAEETDPARRPKLDRIRRSARSGRFGHDAT